MIAALGPKRPRLSAGDGPQPETGTGSRSLNDVQVFAFRLATTLMVAIVIFKAGDGTTSVVPANEYDGNASAIIREVDLFAL
jgi:hypothetical protein